MGKTGWIPSTKAEQKALDRLLGQAQGSTMFSDLYTGDPEAGKGKLSLPFLSVWKFCPEAFDDEAQQTGDCVSHGTRNGCDIPRAVEIDIKGEPEEWVARGATEHIYGMRQHTGQGMSTGLAVRFVHTCGFLARGKYGQYDLSKYTPSLGIKWGSRGTPQELRDEAAKHPMQYFAQVTRNADAAYKEIRAACANGYGVVFGAQYGFSNRRGKYGISETGKPWNHCMSIGGFDDTCTYAQDPLLLDIQSWGPDWISGPLAEYPMPKGSAMIRWPEFYKHVVARGEVYIVGDATGYPARDLPNYGTESYLG